MKTLRSFLERYDHEMEKPTIFYIFTLYPIRKAVLQYVSAYDAAKLDFLLICILRRGERRTYLNPARDLIWNISAMKQLLQEGMKLTLIGDDAPALSQRLHDTKKYLEKYRNRRLKIYLIGTFPILGKTTTTLDRMIEFSTTGNPSPAGTFNDKRQLREIKGAMEPGSDKRILMTFSAPMNPSRATKGSWYKVSDAPDKTLDLRVYVPCFNDRLYGEVFLPLPDISRLSGLSTIFKVYKRGYEFKEGWLTGSGIQDVKHPAQRQLLETDFFIAVSFFGLFPLAVRL